MDAVDYEYKNIYQKKKKKKKTQKEQTNKNKTTTKKNSQEPKRLCLKLSEAERKILQWTKEGKELVEVLKRDLMTAPVLKVPALKKPFHLFVTVSEGAALGVLTQEEGDKRKPTAYLPKRLDPVSRG